MKGILIDPRKVTFTRLEVGADIKDIYKILSDDEIGWKVDIVERVHIRDNLWLWVDEEGLLKQTEDGLSFAFPFHSINQVIVGRGLILGSTPNGEESADAEMSNEELNFLFGAGDLTQSISN